jgi:abortive infection bacteriophage resistance protein
MGNIATNVEQQIKILTDRGLALDWSEDKTKEILLDIGYYRLGFYWNPFVIDEQHNFATGTKFSDAVNLYYLDVDLRNLLLKYLNRIEISFKTAVVYSVSNTYRNSSTWFIDPRVISNEFISTIDNYYNDDFKRNNKAIKKHHSKYLNDKYAPAWKTLEFFTFGTILKIYSNLKNEELQKTIARIYGMKHINKFENHFKTLIMVRNICAHGGVVFDFKMPTGISVIKELGLNSSDRHSMCVILKVIAFYLGKVSESRKTEFLDQVHALFVKHKDNLMLKKLIENNFGHVF